MPSFNLNVPAPSPEASGRGDSGAIRTHDLLLRRELLYPTELLSRILFIFYTIKEAK